MNKKKVYIFSPHPDDETLGCGGIIAKKIHEGKEVIIVEITDGRHAFSKVLDIYTNPTPEELLEIRKMEVKRAVKILGVPKENLIFLDFEDGSLEDNEKEVENKIIDILGENPPSEVYFTYKNDVNPDHRATNRILKNSIKKLGLSIPKYQYSITQKNVARAKIDLFFNFLKRNIIRVDVSKFSHMKKAALNEFKSQIEIISKKQKKPLISLEIYLKNKEIFYKDE